MWYIVRPENGGKEFDHNEVFFAHLAMKRCRFKVTYKIYLERLSKINKFCNCGHLLFLFHANDPREGFERTFRQK